jgi:hypothetical protein
MASLRSRMTSAFGGVSSPPEAPTLNISSALAGIPYAFGFSVYDRAVFTKLDNGGMNFEDKPKVARGTAYVLAGGLSDDEPGVVYNRKERKQKLDGTIEDSNFTRCSLDPQSVLRMQTDAHGRRRLVNTWDVGNADVPYKKIADQVAIGDWYGPDKSTPTMHNTASALATTAGMASIGLGSHPDPLSGASARARVPQGILPSYTEGGETSQWKILDDTEFTADHFEDFIVQQTQTTG